MSTGDDCCSGVGGVTRSSRRAAMLRNAFFHGLELVNSGVLAERLGLVLTGKGDVTSSAALIAIGLMVDGIGGDVMLSFGSDTDPLGSVGFSMFVTGEASFPLAAGPC